MSIIDLTPDDCKKIRRKQRKWAKATPVVMAKQIRKLRKRVRRLESIINEWTGD